MCVSLCRRHITTGYTLNLLGGVGLKRNTHTHAQTHFPRISQDNGGKFYTRTRCGEKNKHYGQTWTISVLLSDVPKSVSLCFIEDANLLL